MKSWIIPETGADFVCAMEDILEVYERPYNEKNPVICFDESPRQLIGEKREPYVDGQGVEHIDYEYIRNGTADLFMICEPLGGRREVFVKDRHTRLEWAEVIRYMAEDMYPDTEKLTLIQDNLSAHKRSVLYEIMEPGRARGILNRIEFVFTPKHGSWLNIAEIELSVLTRQALKRRVGNKDELEQRITEWYEERNRNLKTVDWQFRTKDARIKLKRLYPSVKS
ncbi:MAG: IS630 family transposase [Desulfococcaceae bacterium]